ncbi:protein CHUP1 [Pyrus ussuriensis x Pyrus communis]|uniref:Protein CHUP1 n=1 Tax=Pyrus ussuriensis x Pyrus communis TaxID=2448454 RepID=A0A5N5HVZ9_9ROSA|nr:protein CHUP1 [Pyrus ussuriensis x Pyrus communis]
MELLKGGGDNGGEDGESGGGHGQRGVNNDGDVVVEIELLGGGGGGGRRKGGGDGDVDVDGLTMMVRSLTQPSSWFCKMESLTSKAYMIIKPMLKAAVIPLALLVAGFICAKIMANQSINPKGSSTETDDQVSYLKANSSKCRDEDAFHSFSFTCMLSTKCLEIRDNQHVLEKEISCLRLRLDELQKRESELEMQFIRYCIERARIYSYGAFEYVVIGSGSC